MFTPPKVLSSAVLQISIYAPIPKSSNTFLVVFELDADRNPVIFFVVFLFFVIHLLHIVISVFVKRQGDGIAGARGETVVEWGRTGNLVGGSRCLYDDRGAVEKRGRRGRCLDTRHRRINDGPVSALHTIRL